MTDGNIRHLPVLAGGELVGVLGESDLARCLALDPAGRVEAAMNPTPYAVDVTTPSARWLAR